MIQLLLATSAAPAAASMRCAATRTCRAHRHVHVLGQPAGLHGAPTDADTTFADFATRRTPKPLRPNQMNFGRTSRSGSSACRRPGTAMPRPRRTTGLDWLPSATALRRDDTFERILRARSTARHAGLHRWRRCRKKSRRRDGQAEVAGDDRAAEERTSSSGELRRAEHFKPGRSPPR